jgi:hypothetical protein
VRSSVCHGACFQPKQPPLQWSAVPSSTPGMRTNSTQVIRKHRRLHKPCGSANQASVHQPDAFRKLLACLHAVLPRRSVFGGAVYVASMRWSVPTSQRTRGIVVVAIARPLCGVPPSLLHACLWQEACTWATWMAPAPGARAAVTAAAARRYTF